MKTLLVSITLIISLFWSTVTLSQVYENKTINNQGLTIIQIVNNGNYPVTCFYRDNINFITFILNPRTVSQWIPVYGYYQWGCN